MTIKLNQPYSFCQLGSCDNQEDSRYPNSNCPTDFGPFFIVCDGVGGCADGEKASMAVAEGLGEALNDFDWTQEFTLQDFQQALASAYKKLNAAAREGDSDMATTLTMVCFHAGGCTMAHMGDSRIYQFRPNMGIIYRSEDHSLINELVHSGVVAPEQAMNHPQRNVISRYMAPDTAQEERCQATLFQTKDVEKGDSFFLCSDGVADVVDDHILESIICGEGSDKDKCKKIAQLSHNSPDNNTAYLVSIAEVIKDSDDEDERPEEESGRETKRLKRVVPVAVDVDIAKENGQWGKLVELVKRILKL